MTANSENSTSNSRSPISPASDTQSSSAGESERSTSIDFRQLCTTPQRDAYSISSLFLVTTILATLFGICATAFADGLSIDAESAMLWGGLLVIVTSIIGMIAGSFGRRWISGIALGAIVGAVIGFVTFAMLITPRDRTPQLFVIISVGTAAILAIAYFGRRRNQD